MTKHITMQTNLGTIKLELDDKLAPITTQNFVNYVEKGHYNGSIFHRVIPSFMIQGGGMTADMQEKDTDKSIENEAKNGLKNDRGSIAMARTNSPHSATSQFFINLSNNDFLNNTGAQWGYAVFGRVTEGMDIVDNIAKIKTGRRGHHDDVPTETITIESVTVDN